MADGVGALSLSRSFHFCPSRSMTLNDGPLPRRSLRGEPGIGAPLPSNLVITQIFARNQPANAGDRIKPRVEAKP
jgi:hypothetical protein